jgi:ketosteroid isomerase-like protein
MAQIEEQRRVAAEYVRLIGNGGIDESHLAEDMTAWSFTMGMVPRAEFWPRMKKVVGVFPEPLVMTIDSTTAEPERVAVRSHSHGVLYNGREYSNEYLFLIEPDAAGKIRHAREYFDVRPLLEILLPAIREFDARRTSAG